LQNNEVIAHDEDAITAKNKAEKRGYKDFTLFKVPPLTRSLAPFIA
jgi:hypothetical protein